MKGSFFSQMSHSFIYHFQLLYFLDVRQHPLLLEELLLRRVEAEHQLETALRVGRYPVRILPSGRDGAEVNVHRAVSVLLHLRDLRGAAGAGHVLDQRVRLAVIRGNRPILFNRWISGDSQTIGLATIKRVAVLVADGDEVELSSAQMLDGDIRVG